MDGRRARGERTRLRVLEALLSLVEDGEIRPTAQEVATKAGVALRTVYHHFEDVEALRRIAHDLQVSRHIELLQPVDTSTELEERSKLVARQLRKLFEAITPIRRATLLDEQQSPELAEELRKTRSFRRAHVTSTFAPELASLGDDKNLVDALDQATSWQGWNYLRNDLGRSVPACEKTLATSIERLLGAGAGAGAHAGATPPRRVLAARKSTARS